MHTQADVTLGCPRRLVCVHSHPYSDVDLLRPRMCGDGPLTCQRCGDGVFRTRKDDEEGVALRVDLAAPVFVDERSEELVVLSEDERVVVTEPLQQPRRAFDIREEKGDGAAGK